MIAVNYFISEGVWQMCEQARNLHIAPKLPLVNQPFQLSIPYEEFCLYF